MVLWFEKANTWHALMFVTKGQSQKRYLEKSEMYLFAEMIVYNKMKIQMIFVEYDFYFSRKVKIMYISFVASPLV